MWQKVDKETHGIVVKPLSIKIMLHPFGDCKIEWRMDADRKKGKTSDTAHVKQKTKQFDREMCKDRRKRIK